jgi:hypothetical protein
MAVIIAALAITYFLIRSLGVIDYKSIFSFLCYSIDLFLELFNQSKFAQKWMHFGKQIEFDDGYTKDEHNQQ